MVESHNSSNIQVTKASICIQSFTMNSTTSFSSEGEDTTSSSIFSNSSPKSVACISSRFDSSRLGQYPQKLYLPNEDEEDTDGSKSVTSATSTGTTCTTSSFTAGYNDNTERANLVHTVSENDVLCGRGRGPAGHTGNVRFHELIAEKRMSYLTCTDRKEKANICEEIIDVVKRSGGRFLKKISGRGSKTSPKLWKIVDDAKAKAKTGQALREGYTRETVLRAQLLASVADAATTPTSNNKRSHTADTEEIRSHKKARYDQTDHMNEPPVPVPMCYDDVHSATKEIRTPALPVKALPLKKQIMRRMKVDLLRENQLYAFQPLRGCL